tara:strand:- start:200 stop:364 length:165 start_codon:yes stop_codon:yes gene_type:complete
MVDKNHRTISIGNKYHDILKKIAIDNKRTMPMQLEFIIDYYIKGHKGGTLNGDK